MSEQKELVTGFELDALVDERVFGHTVAWRGNFTWRADIIDEIKANSRGFDLVTESRAAGAWVPQYSTRIADAWLLVEKLKVDGYEISVHNSWPYNDGRRWACDIVKPGSSFWNSAQSDTAPLAICRAALKSAAALSSSPTNLKEHAENE